MVNRLGRKYTVLIANFIYLLTWIILASSDSNAYSLCFARFIGGLGNGVVINVVPIYVTELSDVS